MNVISSFDALVEFLTKAGYSVSVIEYKEDGYRFAHINDENKHIRAGFCTETPKCYSFLSNRIAADHWDCFDKWSKCPLVMRLPLDGDLLLRCLTWLGSKEGYEWSDSYSYIEDPKLPMEM